MKFNMNSYVRVQLTPYGRSILRKDIERRHKYLCKGEYKKYMPKEDADGWSRWQLWRLMNKFGAHVKLSHIQPFCADIEIE